MYIPKIYVWNLTKGNLVQKRNLIKHMLYVTSGNKYGYP